MTVLDWWSMRGAEVRRGVRGVSMGEGRERPMQRRNVPRVRGSEDAPKVLALWPGEVAVARVCQSGSVQ
eukprot:6391561-Pyramimonas_sp.AAC.1